MSPDQQKLLRDLYDTTHDGLDLYESNHVTGPMLQSFREAKLAKRVHVGLWRITARGLLVVRGSKHVPRFKVPSVSVTSPTERVLAIVEGHPGITTSEVAAQLDSTRSSVGQTLKRLHERGRIDRTGRGKNGDPHHYYPLGTLEVA